MKTGEGPGLLVYLLAGIGLLLLSACHPGAAEVSTSVWQPDSSFGNSGFTSPDLGAGIGTSEYLNGIAGDTQDRILITGSRSVTGGYVMYTARLRHDGELDTSFADNGVYLEAVFSIGRDIRVLNDGSILVGGERDNGGDYDAALWRFNSDGTLDNSFGTNGTSSLDIGGNDERSKAMVPDETGNIILAGSTADGSQIDLAVWRVSAGGDPDTVFNDPEGFVTDNSAAGGDGEDISFAVSTDSSGRIVAAGRSWNGTDSDIAVWRYLPDGQPDSSFDGDGVAVYDAGNFDEIFTLTVDSQNRITAGGFGVPSSRGYDLYLLRYLPDGTPDADFGSNGFVLYDHADENDGIYDLIPFSGGRILASGFITGIDDVQKMALFLFDERGNMTDSFGENGIISASRGTKATGNTVGIDSAGRIIVGGDFSKAGGNRDIGVWRYSIN
ncbi:hypothetical protein [Marispirochaeta aestuarii]|uniref:hypothetical protein n=1 Tax=Marispirochaeta aestuarii TaxID=1963862 RepID=UPI0029C96D3A|nr:hypothetical protein [Marispirochaeta aestuarii]